MEIEIIKLIQSINTSYWDTIFLIFSYCASFFAVIIVFVLLFFTNKKCSFVYVIVTGLNVGINYVIKLIINRPRPYQIDNQITNSLEALGKSFPSGHMICATTIVFFLVLVFFKQIKPKWTKILFVFALGIYLFGVAISRMYLGQHYITDIIAGTVLGILLCNVFLKGFNLLNKKHFHKTH